MVPTILKQNKRVDKIKGKSSIKDNVIVKSNQENVTMKDDISLNFKNYINNLMMKANFELSFDVCFNKGLAPFNF